MKKFNFTLTGTTPLLMQADDVLLSDSENSNHMSPKEKSLMASDDRFPPWTWQIHVHRYDNRVAMPIDHVMACLRKAESKIVKSTDKRGKASKSEFLSAIRIHGMEVDDRPSEYLRFTVGKRDIAFDKIDAVRNKPFTEQQEAIRKLGFNLDVKHTTVGRPEHVRVRPMFTNWAVNGAVEIMAPEQVSLESIQELFNMAGRHVGLCDWYSCTSKSYGKYGKFECYCITNRTELEKLEDEIRELEAIENLPIHLAPCLTQLRTRRREMQREDKLMNNSSYLNAQRQSQTCPNPDPSLFRKTTIEE